MSREDHFTRRLLISIDVKGYGGGDDRDHVEIQRGLIAIQNEAASTAGLHRNTWDRQPAGDGELSVLPESEPEPRVVDEYVRELATALSYHNHNLRNRLRVRMAVHFGTAMPADNGFSGQGAVEVGRLVDCDPVRRALDVTDADLAVIISEPVFRDVVLQRHTSLSPGDFREVNVVNKEYSGCAYLRVPGVDVHAIALRQNTRPAHLHVPVSSTVQEPEPADENVPAPPVAPSGGISISGVTISGEGTHNAFGNTVDGDFHQGRS